MAFSQDVSDAKEQQWQAAPWRKSSGGLPASEMPLLTAAIPLSRQEQQKLISWQDPPAWDSRGVDVEPPGRGKFLIKVGGRPGIPVQIGLTSIEKTDGLNDTDTRWHDPAVTLMDPAAPVLPTEGGAL